MSSTWSLRRGKVTFHSRSTDRISGVPARSTMREIHMRKIILTTLAAGVVGTVGLGAAANAATDTGFLGKGDVQSALGWNNAKLQAAVEAHTLKFTSERATTQAVTESATQVGT